MTSILTKSVIITLLIAFATSFAHESDVHVRRYLLSAGANDGGRDKVVLRYAVSDAEAFANVLIEMGGVDKENAIIIANPTRRELLGGIENLANLVAAGRSENENLRSEVFVYYSGHADRAGLRLSSETLSWSEFRGVLHNLEAEVKVTVIDACGSGAITRAKGGVAYPAFLSDESVSVTGYAFLTSSNENQMSQESDHIRGSYFTHALINGMRGAADLVGDGRVTINEAYQYAFNETLRNTQNTRGGAQHPSRDMNFAGTGEIVLTDLRQTSAILSFAPDMEGRLFIRDASGNLFAELGKERGRALQLGIPPGRWQVQKEMPSAQWMSGEITVAHGGSTTISMNDMRPMTARWTIFRGDPAGRNVGRFGRMTQRVNNFFAENYIADLTAYADVSGDVGLSFRLGIPQIYAIGEIGSFIDTDGFQTLNGGWGLGSRFNVRENFMVNFDFVWSGFITLDDGGAMSDWDYWNDPWGDDLYESDHEFWFSQHYKLRLGVMYNLRRNIALVGGVSLNGNYECAHLVDNWRKSDGFGSMYFSDDGRGHRFHVWPGIYAGITVGRILPRGRNHE